MVEWNGVIAKLGQKVIVDASNKFNGDECANLKWPAAAVSYC